MRVVFLFLSRLFCPFALIGGSIFLVAFSQPDWSPLSCIMTSALGYALFWRGMLYFSSAKKRFGLAAIWFAGVQAVHLSWFTSDQYVGTLIYVFFLFLVCALGIFFGFLSLLVLSPDKLSVWRIVGIAGAWTLFEWGRLYFMSGFSWDPLGLSLSATLWGMQLASAFGVFGLTFWVVLTNLFALKCFARSFLVSHLCIWLLIAAVPYLYGATVVDFHEKQMKMQSSSSLSALLVQTALYPEQKVAFTGYQEGALTPVEQWKRILIMLKKHDHTGVDLIVFSEAVVPYGTDLPLYSLDQISAVFEEVLGVQLVYQEGWDFNVGNAYWAQAIANYFQADVVIGLEDADPLLIKGPQHVYNAAFLFRPNEDRQRYEKRVLVPLGEYIPFQWCKMILKKYGIEDSFTPGIEAKVFEGKKAPIGMSICYEETYGHLMRESRLKGAGLLVNLTNDVWYPKSRLPLVHFLHGRIRSVEGGVPVLRASNTGVTCAIDSLGRTIDYLGYEDMSQASVSDALYVTLPLYNYPTLYMRYGDQLIVWFSFLSLLVFASAILFPLPKTLFERISTFRNF